MTTRASLKRQFLDTTPWRDARIQSMTGDASNRAYDRLYLAEKSAILMDAPPERGEDVRPFVQIGEHLLAHGFSAPQILARDIENGFLLLEDLGAARFKETIEQTPAIEAELYRAATDALVALHQCPLPDVPTYDADQMVAVCDPVFSHYRKQVLGDVGETEQLRFNTEMRTFLKTHVTGPQVLVERDYHAENLLWLPDRHGVARVGMLDFQDAVRGHPAYDLVSMLQDARRDVSAEIERQMINHYIAQTATDRVAFETAYWALGLQRNIRIVGIFARLATAYGKPHYVDFIPRVWEYIERGLARPELGDIAAMIRDIIPPPTLETLRKLRP